MQLATFVGRYLAARGVRHIFGHPGSDVMELIEACDQAGIPFVLTHHENTAAYMAKTVGFLTGTPGVVMVTKGPGATNVVSGVAAAQLDRAPLLAFSAYIDAERRQTYVHQHVALEELYRPVSKLAAELTAANAHDLLPRAFQFAAEWVPGAVYLPTSDRQQVRDLPLSDADLTAAITRAPDSVRPDAQPLPPDLLAEVAAAKRLVVVVGPGVNSESTGDDLVRTVEALGAPVVLTPEALGQVPADHPLYAGLCGWHDAPVQDLLAGADLVLTLGLDGWDVNTSYRGPAPVVSLAPVVPADPSFQPLRREVHGPLADLLRQVRENGRGWREWGPSTASESRAQLEQDLAVTPGHAETDGVPPQSVFTDLRAVCPRDTFLSVDVGAHKSLGSQAWSAYQPRSFLVSDGLSPMGVGLPGAMAARMVYPDRPSVCVMGDGGLLMYAGELATLARLGLGVTVVVLVDGALTQVQRRQERRGYSLASTTFQSVDFVALARSLGVDAVRADDTRTYREAVANAAATTRPVLVEAHIDAAEYRRLPGAP